MKTSDNIGALAAALSAAQGEMPAATKDAKNSHLNNSYATLGSIIATAAPVLARHGLSYVQMPSSDEPGFMALTTRLMHSSGEWIEGTMRAAVPSSKLSEIQAAGSVVSYLRRYALSAALGIMTEDDDGHAASQPTRPAQTRTQALQTPAPQTVSPVKPSEALTKLHGQIKRAGEKLSGQGHGDEARALLKGVAGWKTDEAQARAAYRALCDLGVSKATVSESETTVHRPALMGHARRVGADAARHAERDGRPRRTDGAGRSSEGGARMKTPTQTPNSAIITDRNPTATLATSGGVGAEHGPSGISIPLAVKNQCFGSREHPWR
ncbi:ERF family protein [Deinococcus sp.]|uniref:ERF family protein n=1 Tax=Deinococcus sp. TaxID=47478 RepID=UPI0025CF695B|nr:ERF family protein [Deinococcus sp.]